MHPEDIEARVAKLSPQLRPLVRAMTLRIDLSTVFGVPPEELVDQELAAEFRDVVEQMSEDPVLRAEWVEFWLAFAAGFPQQSYED